MGENGRLIYVRMDLKTKKGGWEVVDYIHMAQNRDQ
jgi:hypothetical protein